MGGIQIINAVSQCEAKARWAVAHVVTIAQVPCLVHQLLNRSDVRHQRIAIYGRGEAAELAYLSVKEFGLEPVAIFDADGGGTFIGMAVRPFDEQASVSYDLLIAATLASSGPVIEELLRRGVPRSKLLTLRQEQD